MTSPIDSKNPDISTDVPEEQIASHIYNPFATAEIAKVRSHGREQFLKTTGTVEDLYNASIAGLPLDRKKELWQDLGTFLPPWKRNFIEADVGHEAIPVDEVWLIFIDVCDFTTLSEALFAKGDTGIELMAAVMNAFMSLLEELYETYNLHIIYPEGDAQLAFGVGLPLKTITEFEASIKAKLAEFRSHPLLQRVKQVLPNFEFEVKTGIHYEESGYLAKVGDPFDRTQIMYRGPSTYEVVGAAKTRGVTTYTKAAQERLDRDNNGHPAMSESVKKILEPNKCPDYSEEDMAKILTHGISALRNGTWQNLPLFLRNEPVHEKAVILSVFISGLSYQTPADFKRLEALYVELCAIIKRFFGSDQTLTIAPNGEKFFVTFGGSRLEEKNEDRALECAELIREAINQTGLTAKFGVASGQMCYLPVGGKYKEPSPFGNGFNTSARIAAGPLVENNDIWVEGQVARRLPDINWSRSEVVRFKGQSIDRQICLYGGKKNPDVFFAPLTPIDFLGRQEDVQNLDRALNTDGLTYVGGLTGSGKSSLIGYYLQNYVDQETKIVGAQSNFYDRAPYEGIRFCLYQLADIVPSDNLSDKKNKWDKFYNQVFPNDNFSPQKISLDMILGLIPESKETDLSFNLLRSAVANLLQAYSKTAPLYLVLENAHYLDSSSRTLIQQVLAELGPESGLKWIVAGDEKQTSENFLKSFPLVSLGLFSSAEAKQFILNRLSSSLGDSGQLSEAVYQYLEKKSGRNPALLSELCDLLLQSDLKDPRQKKFLAPDDVNVWDLKNEAELNSIKLGLEGLQDRIGLLSKGPKEIIEWAGFLGETFSKGDILTLLPLAGVRTNPDEVAENFEELVKAGLLIRTPETEDKYCFSHGHIPLQIQEKMGTQARFLRHLLLTDTLYKDEPQAAFVHYREALQNKPAAKPEEGIIRAFIENGLEVAKMAEKELDPEAAIKIYHELEAQTAYLTENESALLNYRLGENYALLGNIEKAMEYYEKYREVTEKNLTPAEELGVVFALCQLYKKRHNPTDLETIKNLTSKTNRKLKGKRYQETLSEADLKKWTYYLREAKTLADSYDWFKEKDPLKKARLLAKLTQKKEALYKKIKADFEGFSDELAPELIRTSNNLAMLYKRSGNKEKAEQVLLEAENMGEKLLAEKDLSLAECQLIGDTVMQLIYLYSSCDKNKMAAYQDKAKQLLKPTNLLAYIQTLFCMSESIPLEAGSDLQKKYDLNIESYRLSKQINHDDGVIYSLANLIQWLHYMIPITSEKKPELTSRLKNFFNMIQTIFAKIDMKQSENQKKFAGIPEFLKEMEEKYQG